MGTVPLKLCVLSVYCETKFTLPPNSVTCVDHRSLFLVCVAETCRTEAKLSLSSVLCCHFRNGTGYSGNRANDQQVDSLSMKTKCDRVVRNLGNSLAAGVFLSHAYVLALRSQFNIQLVHIHVARHFPVIGPVLDRRTFRKKSRWTFRESGKVGRASVLFIRKKGVPAFRNRMACGALYRVHSSLVTMVATTLLQL